MRVSQQGIDQIKSHEGLRLKAYQDQVWVWTIGYGNTFYQNGYKVKKGDIITKDEAERLIMDVVDSFASEMEKYIKVDLNQNQFDALVSFAYNVGVVGFSKSTLLKLVNKNPNDSAIRDQFMVWNKGTLNGKKITIPGLTNRRKKEADLYFKK